MAELRQGVQVRTDDLHMGSPVVIGHHLQITHFFEWGHCGNMGELADQIQLLLG
ncbi:hypothetical protein D3C71_1991600 [compost metagenome]